MFCGGTWFTEQMYASVVRRQFVKIPSHSQFSKHSWKKILSGFGGQVDFVYGSAAALDGQGKAIIALSSCTGKGDSKIVPYLKHVCASAIFANAYLAQFLGISKDFWAGRGWVVELNDANGNQYRLSRIKIMSKKVNLIKQFIGVVLLCLWWAWDVRYSRRSDDENGESRRKLN